MRTIRFNSVTSVLGVGMAVLALVAVAPTRVWGQTEALQQTQAEAFAKRTARAELLVESNNWLDMHLYLVRNGVRSSLGFMTGPGREKFILPSTATVGGADVQLLVLPIGSRDAYLSPLLVINPGDDVRLSVQNILSLSSVAVFPAS